MTWTTGPSAGAVFVGTREVDQIGYQGGYLVGGTDFGADLVVESERRCPLSTGAPDAGSIVLGAGEKDVAVPFDSVRVTNKNNSKWYLVMNATKDELKGAPGFKYDSDTTSWVPDGK